MCGLGVLESGTSRSRCDASLLFSGWQWSAFKGVVRFLPGLSTLSLNDPLSLSSLFLLSPPKGVVRFLPGFYSLSLNDPLNDPLSLLSPCLFSYSLSLPLSLSSLFLSPSLLSMCVQLVLSLVNFPFL